MGTEIIRCFKGDEEILNRDLTKSGLSSIERYLAHLANNLIKAKHPNCVSSIVRIEVLGTFFVDDLVSAKIDHFQEINGQKEAVFKYSSFKDEPEFQEYAELVELIAGADACIAKASNKEKK